MEKRSCNVSPRVRCRSVHTLIVRDDVWDEREIIVLFFSFFVSFLTAYTLLTIPVNCGGRNVVNALGNVRLYKSPTRREMHERVNCLVMYVSIRGNYEPTFHQILIE